MADHTLRKQQRDAERIARRAEAVAARRQAGAERDARKEADRARRAAAQVAEEEARQALEARVYDHYLRVREWIRGWRDDYAAAAGPPSEIEAAQARGLAHLWEASPGTIASLRLACEPLGGACAGDYGSRGTERFGRLKREVFFLRKQLGPELFVQEPRALGGFGYYEQTLLYNEDTARHFGVLIALQDAAILQAFRAPGARRVVWEAGGGWGGFAYQFTRVCPDVTYVITGSPEQLLVSAVYLAGVLPEARCRLHAPAADAGSGWPPEEVDFVFVPAHLLPAMRPPRLDLTLDLMALRAMTPARAAAHVQRSFDLGGRYFFGLRPGVASPDDVCVEGAVARWYWPHPVPPRRDARQLAAVGGDPAKLPPPAFACLAGWRRVRV